MKLIFAGFLIAFAMGAMAQNGHDVTFEEYNPPSTLVVPEHPLTRSKYPFIDVHNHQFGMPNQNLNTLIVDMDDINMGIMVNLSGRGRGETSHLDGAISNIKRSDLESRLVVFTNISFEGIDHPDWSENAAKQLEEDVQKGARGLKIYKSLGLRNTDATGARIAIDDPIPHLIPRIKFQLLGDCFNRNIFQAGISQPLAQLVRIRHLKG